MKLVLFCDYGLDDAAATADALAHAAEDGYEQAVLVAIGGNVPPAVALENARNQKTIGKSLEAQVTLKADGELYDFLKENETVLEPVFIVSKVCIKEPKRTMLQRKLLYDLCA